jgi:hypothetical protein
MTFITLLGDSLDEGRRKNAETGGDKRHGEERGERVGMVAG